LPSRARRSAVRYRRFSWVVEGSIFSPTDSHGSLALSGGLRLNLKSACPSFV
jgi:hypothetical protein